MKWTISILAAVFMTAWAGVAAQSSSSMNQDKKSDGMATMGEMDVTYTGCIEAAGAGKFTLTQAVAAASHMATHSMKEPPMNEMAMDTMKKDNMMSTTLTLSSSAVDVAKHLGQKVSVTGSLTPQMASIDKGTVMKEPPSFTVKSLKTISRSCS